jgi:hypothetical protein
MRGMAKGLRTVIHEWRGGRTQTENPASNDAHKAVGRRTSITNDRDLTAHLRVDVAKADLRLAKSGSAGSERCGDSGNFVTVDTGGQVLTSLSSSRATRLLASCEGAWIVVFPRGGAGGAHLISGAWAPERPPPMQMVASHAPGFAVPPRMLIYSSSGL